MVITLSRALSTVIAYQCFRGTRLNQLQRNSAIRSFRISVFFPILGINTSLDFTPDDTMYVLAFIKLLGTAL
jgi:hypothetical protein